MKVKSIEAFNQNTLHAWKLQPLRHLIKHFDGKLIKFI